MNINTAIRNFELLRKDVLEDGKVDDDEVRILIDFLEPYTKTYSRKFSRLKVLLHEARTTGVDQKKSLEIAEALDDAMAFLKWECKVERTLGYLIAGFVIMTFFYLLIN